MNEEGTRELKTKNHTLNSWQSMTVPILSVAYSKSFMNKVFVTVVKFHME